jgi:hypothetical protein
MSNGIVGPYSNLPVVVTRADEAAATEPTSEQQQIAKDFPPGMVQLERKGAQLGMQIPGGLLALGGATLLGISLLSRRAPGAAESRLLASPLLIGGGLVAAGAGLVGGSSLIGPKSTLAVATNIPTQARAGEIAGTYVGRQTKVVQDIHGKWAVLDEGPARSGGGSGGSYGYERGRGHYYGDGHFHGHHYHGDGHYHPRDYYPDPYYPGSGDYYPIPYDPPSYPSNPYPGGGTSGGDDYDYTPSYPSNPGGGTSSGDDYDYSPPSYDPPSYDPPSYDPPSYDPPSYDPPSYDPPSYDPPSYDPPSYDPPSYDSGGYGDSSSNGNPSYDDF